MSMPYEKVGWWWAVSIDDNPTFEDGFVALVVFVHGDYPPEAAYSGKVNRIDQPGVYTSLDKWVLISRIKPPARARVKALLIKAQTKAVA